VPKKKTTTIVEEADETTPVYGDIHDKPMEEIVTESKDKSKKEEKKEESAEEEKEEVKTEEKEEEFDIEENNRKVAEETAKKTKDAIVEALQDKDGKQTPEKVDAYTEWAKQFNEETGKQPTWVDVAKFTKDQAKAEILAEQEEKDKSQQEEVTKQKEAVKAAEDQFNKELDEELDELYQNNIYDILL